MKDDFIHIGFDHTKHPEVQFDLVRLENLLTREYSDHDPREIHKVDFYIILIATEGSGMHSVDFKDYTYERGSVVTVRKDQLHKFHQSKAEGFLLLFTDQFLVHYLEQMEHLKSLQLFNELLGSPILRLDDQEFQSVTELIENMDVELNKRMDEYSPEIIRSQLHILITLLFRFKSSRHSIPLHKKYLDTFIKFQELVEHRCFHSKQVSFYAKELGFSTKTLNNVVQQIVGKPAKLFIDEIVILQIKRLLINSNLSVKEIAYEAGFDEPTNLFKFFRKYVGMPPETFRHSNT